MIGQKKCLKTVDTLIQSDFPRFVLITGPEKSGKRMIAKEIAKKLDAVYYESGIKVDDVREVIIESYKQSEPIVYVFPEIDRMNISAKNALLKVTEEPPRRAYFIITVKDKKNVLPTLISRSQELFMDIYTVEELNEYARMKGYTFSSEDMEFVNRVARTPGDIDYLSTISIKEFKEYVELVLDNIGVVNGANALKIGNKFAYKPEDSGWDISVFLRAFSELCLYRIINVSADKHYAQAIGGCGRILSKLDIVGIDKKTLVDMWILDMRYIWSDCSE